MSLHRTLRVGRSTIDDWVTLRSETGTVASNPLPSCPRRDIPALVAFEAFALRHPHATLVEMACHWHKETEESLSLQTFSRTLRRIGWTRKKELSLLSF